MKHQKKQINSGNKQQQDQWMGKGVLHITLLEQDQIGYFINEGRLIAAPIPYSKTGRKRARKEALIFSFSKK
ncbi:MAG: hypothetical protein IPH31_23105 [Lewinellaceae bacterium]|nr:hypothetical protein [Lewinellaceae bacterium]